MKNSNIKWTKEMLELLAWEILEEVFGNSIEWSEKENNSIDEYIQYAKSKLDQKQINFVNAFFRKMKNSYKANLLYSLEKMYYHELHDDYRSLSPPVEFDEKAYEIWTKAVVLRKTVQMTYDSTTSGIMERLVDPYKTSTPYGEGYCHLKKDIRKFRFDRIVEINFTDHKFIKPKNWKS